ncbi:MAG: hypothetical protein KDD45_03595 [Bdellovibrionales bacterium]|nr:hypothetical protein [Bdellovibrionales bacterium]
MNYKPTVLIISFTDHNRDPRVYRQIRALVEQYDITTAGRCKNVDHVTKHVELVGKGKSLFGNVKTAVQLKTNQYEARYWGQSIVKNAISKLNGMNFEVVISNDLETLPVALQVAHSCGAKVLFDAHEYEPKVLDEQFIFNFFFAGYYDYLCRLYLPLTDAMTTVNQGIAEEYAKNYGIESKIIVNAPVPEHLLPVRTNNKYIHLIHHGGINCSRKIENMIHLVGSQLGEGYKLDLMLVNNDSSYMHFLKKEAKRYSNIEFITPVPMQEISTTINKYDIGLYMLPPASFNNRLSLPNKFFEFIQARLAVAIWPSPEMKRIVEQEKIGIVSEDFSIESMAIVLKSLTKEKIEEYKKNTDIAAKKYNADVCADQIREIVKGLLS